MTPRGPRTRAASANRSIALLVAAAVVVIAVVGAVLMFGIQPPPVVEPLDEDTQPSPEAAVAWLAHDGGETCLRIAWPDGSDTRPWCDDTGGEVTGWDGTTVAISDYSGGSRRRVEIDPRTGEVLEVMLEEDPLREDRPPIHPAPSVATFRDGGEQVFVLDDDELWRVEAPERYDVRTSSLSPDGAWVAMVDAADRLLVIPSDGSAPPRLWVDEVSEWRPLVWQGS